MKTILERITEAAKMGYSAIIEQENDPKSPFRVLKVYDNHFDAYSFETSWGVKVFKGGGSDYKITSYLYVGQLFGEPVIPEGAKFRVKATGEVWNYVPHKHKYIGTVRLSITRENYINRLQLKNFGKEELEPIFI